jgi:hypothetical protein
VRFFRRTLLSVEIAGGCEASFPASRGLHNGRAHIDLRGRVGELGALALLLRIHACILKALSVAITIIPIAPAVEALWVAIPIPAQGLRTAVIAHTVFR